MDVNQARQELAEHNRKGTPVLCSATIYWSVMFGLSFFIESASLLALIYLYGTGLLLPLGLLIAKVMKIEMYRKINPLSGLSGLIASTPAFMAPLTAYIYLTDPAAMPFAMAIITGAHFFPFAWLYQSKSFVFSPLIMMAASLVSIFTFPDMQFLIIPIFMIVSLVGMVVWALSEQKERSELKRMA
ncbi:DUF7010 family protein [Halobacillus litoralis]|uniref:DUF7010 family protein n=1 Tax=Halobacillus litoralis TaxID=45668 RepID=UPI0024939057|nr:hypothetical protein [Halobacillus litoralis]